MPTQNDEGKPHQLDLFEVDEVRSILDQLLDDSRLYRKSQRYIDLLDFASRLRNFAPFNAMLLNIQKPGLTYAASAYDWRVKFERHPKKDARPLVILWPFGPVAFVYDVQDTEGKDLPDGVYCFYASGPVDEAAIARFIDLAKKKNIICTMIDAGDSKAGSIQREGKLLPKKPGAKVKPNSYSYSLKINKNHCAPTQFATLAHELGHLFLGHLDKDNELNIPDRSKLSHHQEELEAESVAYLLCKRNGVETKSDSYLATYVKTNITINNLDMYQVMRAAGRVEEVLGLTAHNTFEDPKKKKLKRKKAK